MLGRFAKGIIKQIIRIVMDGLCSEYEGSYKGKDHNDEEYDYSSFYF